MLHCVSPAQIVTDKVLLRWLMTTRTTRGRSAASMAGFYHLDHKEVIHVRVQKLDGKTQSQYKKFSIDPQITSFEMLQGILARAFEINSDFTISYLARDSKNRHAYLSMLSDWDMDAAFQCAAEPFLKLRVDLHPFEELEDWDVIAPCEIPQHGLSDKASIFGPIPGVLTHNLDSTVDSMHRVMGLKHPENEVIKPIKTHMTETEFRNYLDSAGSMVQPDEFRLSVYQGGIEPSLRRVAWRHLLNIYPAHLSSQDRLKYLKRKEEEYHRLRNKWQGRFSSNTATDDVKHVVCMVERDVLRTDRSHEFYAGSDRNANTLSLYHILVTYALTHPDISYCQGMSDLASPLLVTQKNEGQAYICFCSLMDRLRQNFTSEGTAILTKFRHLSELLCLYDPDLYTHLQQNSAEDMFFCYRWLLLELKREFPLNDALRVLEVMWATLPFNPPEGELALVDTDYSSQLLSTSPGSPSMSFQHAMKTKFLSLRRFGNRTQSAKPITSPAHRASVNNNFSTEPSPHNISPSPSIISPLNESLGEQEDKPAGSPQVDKPVSYLVQQSSDNIGGSPQVDNSVSYLVQQSSENIGGSPQVDNSVSYLVQQSSDNIEGSPNKQLLDKGSDDIICHYSDVLFSCPGNIVTDDRFWTSSGLYYPDDIINPTLEVGHCNSCPSLFDFCNGMPVEQTCVHHCTDFSSELDTGRQSWSLNSVASESSQTDNPQTQFTLSLDSNTNHSTDTSGVMTEMNGTSSAGSSETESEKAGSSECEKAGSSETESEKAFSSETESEKDNKRSVKLEVQNKNLSRIEANHSLFQSVKQLLTASYQQPASNLQEANGLSPSSARRSWSQVSQLPPFNEGSSTGKTRTGLVKNMSDSHISDCQEATEDFGNSESTGSSFSNSPNKDPSQLPPPHELGVGNPFLMFLCLSLLIQHRTAILSQGMCYEEIAMHFDRLVRKHNATYSLHFARQMYTQYLRAQHTSGESACRNNDEFGLSCSGIF